MAEETVRLYLEDWQQRAVAAVYGPEAGECKMWDIPITSEIPRMLYMGPPDTWPKGLPRLYFTNWQKRQLHKEVGSDCSYIELDPENPRDPIVRYMGPPAT